MNDEEIEKAITLWQAATSLNEVGELTAKWIEGTLPFYPLDGSETIYDEGLPLRETLAFYNRNGFITTFSQPAEELDEEGFAQRACVEGFANEEVSKKLETISLSTSLLVFIFDNDFNEGYRIPITLGSFRPFTWCGDFSKNHYLEIFETVLSENALYEIELSTQVVIIDLQWGRKDFLWEQITKVLNSDFDKQYAIK